MIKTLALLTRKPELTRDQFDEHWHHPHGDPLSLAIDTLRHYVQSTRRDIDLGGPAAGYDGIAEVWLDDLETAAGLTEHPKFAAAAADQVNFMLPHEVRYLITEEHALAGDPGPGNGGGVKLMQLVRRAEDCTPKEFHAAWADPADSDAGASLGAARHVRCAVIEPAYQNGEEPVYDGVRELWFDDVEALRHAKAAAPDAWRSLFAPAVADGSSSPLLACTQRRLR
jgi:uncharacterized protein (TIGR02118 family)